MKNRGFSLIEVLTAITITAIVASSVYFSFSGILTGRSTIKESSERYRRVYFTLDLMKRDIENAFLTMNRGAPEETHITIFKGIPDSPVSHLTFSSLNHAKMVSNVKSCSQTEIEYYGDNIDGENVLMRRESSWIDAFPEKGGNVYPLLSGFNSVLIEYWDEDRKEWKQEWNTESIDTGEVLPSKIKISMDIRDESDGGLPFFVESIVEIKVRRPFSF